jgi:hypothetical protein
MRELRRLGWLWFVRPTHTAQGSLCKIRPAVNICVRVRVRVRVRVCICACCREGNVVKVFGLLVLLPHKATKLDRLKALPRVIKLR